MWDENLLYLVFFSQILLISAFLPRIVLTQIKQVLAQYPPSTHNKLYPMPIELINSYARRFWQLNVAVVIIGLSILLEKIYSGSDEMLNWDTQSVITIYWLLQFLPYAFAGFITQQYLALMRAKNTDSKRRADMQPRKLSNFVSPIMLGCAVLLYLIFIAMVIYFVQHPFDGFAGYWNILFVTLMNACLGFSIFNMLYRKKSNPHEEKNDSNFRAKITINFLVLISIGGTLFIGSAFVLSAFDLRHITDIVHSFYFQLIVLFNLNSYRLDKINFSVYQSSPQT